MIHVLSFKLIDCMIFDCRCSQMITISHVGEGPVHSAVVGQEAEAKENFGSRFVVLQDSKTCLGANARGRYPNTYFVSSSDTGIPCQIGFSRSDTGHGETDLTRESRVRSVFLNLTRTRGPI